MKSDKQATRLPRKITGPLVEGISPFLSQDSETEVCTKILMCVHEVCVLYGLNISEVQRKRIWEATRSKWQVLIESDRLLSYLKLKFACLFSWAMNQDLPDTSKFDDLGERQWWMLLGGVYGRFLRRMKELKDFDKKMSFFYSLLMAKKGLPRPDEKALAAELTTTFRDLTRTDRVKENIDDLIEEVRRTTREVFRDKLFDEQGMIPYPSIRGHFGWTRKMYGALGKLEECGYICLQPGKRFGGVDNGFLFGPEEWVARRIFWEEECIVPDVIVEINPRIGKWRRELTAELEVVACLEKPKVKLVALAEPLKIRVISKGPALTYAVLHRLRKFMFQVLTQVPNFVINRPVNGIELSKIVGSLEKDQVFISGDYKAATNELDPRLSRACVEEICRCSGLSGDMIELFINGMTNHYIMDPDSGEFLPQEWGQLMGSPVSFPVLCIVNMALSRLAVCPNSSIRDSGIIVNGDDIVFRGLRSDFENWERVTARGGLKSSVGKTYVSSEWLCMNSEVYKYNTAIGCGIQFSELKKFGIEDPWIFRRIPFVNMGLMYGMKRASACGDNVKKSMDDVEDGMTFGARCRKMIEYFDIDFQRRLVERFIYHNRDAFPPAPVPWFLSEVLGGLGLPNILEGYNTSRLDKAVAGGIIGGYLEKPPASPTIDFENRLRSSVLYDEAAGSVEELIGMKVKGEGYDRLVGHYLWNSLCHGIDEGAKKLGSKPRLMLRLQRYWGKAILKKDCHALDLYQENFNFPVQQVQVAIVEAKD